MSVPTRDIDVAVELYGPTLGLPRSAHSHERGFAEFGTANIAIGIWHPESMVREPRPTPNPIAPHVEDVAAARAELEPPGVSFTGDAFDTGVCHMAFFADPDANALIPHDRCAPRES